MSTNRNEEQLNELDRELAQMAQDVPEMPADFHARWAEQIRAEAGQAEAETRKENRRQWRYVLSAAAVFIFLIGGTLITRNAGNRNVPDSVSSNDAVVTLEAAALQEEAEEALFAKTAANALITGEDAAEASGNAVEDAVFADTAAGAAEVFEEAAEEAMAEPDRKEAFAAAPAAEEHAADAGAADAGFLSFLKDLGIFTLKTLAVVLCGAALACLAAVVHRALKNRKK